MEKEDTLIINHEKLGELKFKKINETYVKFSKDKAKKILTKGIKHLSKQGLLTSEEKDNFEELIKNSEIDIKKDLGDRTSLYYQYITSSGKLLSITLLYDEFLSQYNPEEMISDLLDNLCQIIVKVKYPMDLILEKEKYESSSYGVYGKHWVKYAEALLSEERVLSCKLSLKALDYFTYKLTDEQKDKLKEEFGDDLIDSMVQNYVDITMSDFDGENQDNLLSPEDYIEDRMYDYEQEHKTI